MKRLFLYCALVLCISSFSANAQQVRTPLPSPNVKLIQTIGITDISLTYSRPGVKAREIWGKLVPFGSVWRTGANMATVFEISDPITVEGQKLPAGKYAFFTIPAKDEWTVIFNKTWNQGGAGNYKQEEDVLRIKVKPLMVADTKEWFEFSFDNLTDNSATMTMAWEKLRLPVKIEVNTKELVLTKARAAVSWVTSMQFAQYCLQNNTNLDEAAKMIDISISIQKTYRNHVVKARILDKAGKKTDAVKIYEEAVTMGKAEKTPPFDLADVEKELAALKAKK